MSNPSTPSAVSSPSPDDEAILRAKQEIQSLVQEMVDLSKSDVDAEEFYAALVDKSVSALAAIGGVVWTIDETAGFKLQYQMNLRESGLVNNPAAQMQHARLLEGIVKKGEPTLVAPHSGAGGVGDDDHHVAANPTDHLLVIAPISTDQGVDGLVEIFQRAGAKPSTQRGYMRFLLQMCELAGEYLKTQRLRHFVTKQTLWEQLESFTAEVHQHLNSRETAYTIANEGRRLIGCDRVTVVLRKGSKYDVEAISGQDTFDKRSNNVRLLRNLARTVCRSGEDLHYSGDTANFAPQVERAVNEYVDESQTKQLYALPLHEADPNEDDHEKRRTRVNILGAIIIEQLVDGRQPEGLMQRIDVVRRHSAASLTNAQMHEGLFLMPVWRTIGRSRALVAAHNLPKTAAVAIALTAAILAMCLIPWDFNMVADGKLLPEVRQRVFARLDGTIDRVHVTHGAMVEAGAVVAEQRSNALDAEMAQFDSELEKIKEQIATAKKRRAMLLDPRSGAREVDLAEVNGQLEAFDKELEGLQKRHALLQEKREDLTITAPIDGRVTTWRVAERIEGRPVTRGQQLMEIADPSGRWEAELYVPESKMGHIHARREQLLAEDPDARLELTFILATHPDASQQIAGQVEEIHTTAEVEGEQGNTVRMRVSFDQQELVEKLRITDPNQDLKVGADLKAKIYCGQRPIGYVWFHDLFEFVQSRILFRLF